MASQRGVSAESGLRECCQEHGCEERVAEGLVGSISVEE